MNPIKIIKRLNDMNPLKGFTCPQEAFLYYVRNSDSAFTYVAELKRWMSFVKGLDQAKDIRTVKELLMADKRFKDEKDRYENKVDVAYQVFLEDYFRGHLSWEKNK